MEVPWTRCKLQPVLAVATVQDPQLLVSKRAPRPLKINGAFSATTESEASVLLVLMKAL